VTVFKVGDKAISVGEGSQVKIRRAVLGHGAIGVASKDSSLVEIHDSDISDFDYALSAYQKKPEFGGGKIIAVNVKTPAPIYEGLKSKVQIGSVR